MKEEREGREGREEEEEGEGEEGMKGKLTRQVILEEAREEPEKAQSLDFHNRQIRDISILETCTKLKTLDLSFNLVNSLASMRHLKNLKVLRLYNNELESLQGVQYLCNLQFLSVDSNRLKSVAEIKNLKFLYELSAAFNELSEIAPGHLPNSLRKLDLCSNGIEKLQGLNALIRLEQLSISNNQLTDLRGLPTSPCQLKEFHASGNQIKSIRGLEKYSEHLDIVRLEDNFIGSLSNIAKDFTEVTELYLSGNKISELAGVEHFTNVEILDLSCNHLYDIDGLKLLCGLEELRDLKVEGNPFAMGDTYRDQVTATLPEIECLDDQEIESRVKAASAGVAGGLGKSLKVLGDNEMKVMPRAPAGARPPTPSRRPTSAAKLSHAQRSSENKVPMMHSRPKSARSGSGSRLLTATQYEDETKAFEEQVFGYQRTMEKLLKEMKKNLELPMDEVASMVKASGDEVLTAHLPEPPVIAAIKQHKESTFVRPGELLNMSDYKMPSKPSERIGRQESHGPGPSFQDSNVEKASHSGSRFATAASEDKVIVEERDLHDDLKAEEGKESYLRSDETDQYEYLRDKMSRVEDSLSSSVNRADWSSDQSPPSTAEKSPKQVYKNFKKPSARPLSARKSANREVKPVRPLSARKNSISNTNKEVKTARSSSGSNASHSSKGKAGKVTVPKVSRLKGNTFKLKT